jgi:hypothetical protein
MRNFKFASLSLGMSLAIAGTVVGLSGGLTGCQNIDYFEKIKVDISENLESIKLSLVFKNTVKFDYSGRFMVQEYGSVFLTPFTATQPFEIGFDLSTNVFNDQDYVNLDPTKFLPNGMPTGLTYPVVQVSGKTPVSDKFDIFGYVDVKHFAWLGASAMLTVLDKQKLPENIFVQKTFMRDDANNPTVYGSVFGPELNSDGTVKRSAGVAVFANVKALINKSKQVGKLRYSLKPEKTIQK